MSALEPHGAGEAKYFLIRVLHEYGLTPVQDPIRVLEEKLGLPDGQVKKARDALVKAGYLKERLVGAAKTSGESKARAGAFIKGFEVNRAWVSQCLKELRGTRRRARRVGGHDGLIEYILFSVGKSGRRIGHFKQERSTRSLAIPVSLHDLRPITRLVLAVLLDRASDSGAVREAGKAELSKLACVHLSRLDDQIKVLEESGYILAKISGVTGVYAFGVAPGAFFLNLVHPAYRNHKTNTTLIVCVDETVAMCCLSTEDIYREAHSVLPFEERLLSRMDALGSSCFWYGPEMASIPPPLQSPAQDLRKAVKDFDQTLGWSCSWGADAEGEQHPVGLYRLFIDRQAQGFDRYLQYKVEEYAAGLLSNYWGCLGELHDDPPRDLLYQIGDDIFPANLRRRAETSEFPGQATAYRRDDPDEARPEVEQLIMARSDALEIVIFRLAIELALTMKEMVLTSYREYNIELPRAGAAYSILPLQICERTELQLYAVCVTCEATSDMGPTSLLAISRTSPDGTAEYERGNWTFSKNPEFNQSSWCRMVDFLDADIRNGLFSVC